MGLCVLEFKNISKPQIRKYPFWNEITPSSTSLSLFLLTSIHLAQYVCAYTKAQIWTSLKPIQSLSPTLESTPAQPSNKTKPSPCVKNGPGPKFV